MEVSTVEEMCRLWDVGAPRHCHYASDVRSMPSRGGKHISKGTGSRAFSRAERVERAAQRLRELQASGVALSEVLGGQAGAAFVHEDCEGDPEVAASALALVYAPRGRDGETKPFGALHQNYPSKPNFGATPPFGLNPPS